MAEVPGFFKVFFPLLYYGLCTTLFVFFVIEHDEWENLNKFDFDGDGTDETTAGKHALEYAQAEYTICLIGFALVLVDFAVTIIISGIKGTLMSTEIYAINKDASSPIDIAAAVFRKLGVFGAYWGTFMFLASTHLSLYLLGKSDADNDIYIDLIPFFIPPIIGLLLVVLPQVTPNDYVLVATGNYM